MKPGPILADGSFRRALRIQMNVLGALVMREMHTRFGRENLGYVWLFIEPMILAGSVALLHQVTGHGLPGGLMPFAFYILSYTPHYLLRAILTRAPSTLEANVPLFFHARVKLLDALLARTILECAAVLVATTVFLLAVGVVMGSWPVDPVGVALGIVAMALFSHGVGLLTFSATVLGHQNVERIIHPATYLALPLSGSFFMMWWLPTELRDMAWYIPTVHVYELMRDAYYGPVVPYYHDAGYLAAWVLAVNFGGLLALRAARDHLEA